MSKLSPRLTKLALTLLLGSGALSLALSGALSASRATARQDLPEGQGVEAVRAKCLTCHEADLITQQRLTRAGWVREVDKMIRWGAEVSAAEKEAMVEYLSERFAPPQSPARTAASSVADRGQEIFQNKCLICHEADLTEQQRLTRAGWVREVDKMIRWGAEVSEAEKGPLVDYLSRHFGPKKDSPGK
jgi:cytochrome c5